MRILEYTLGLPPYRRGGLVKYSLDLTRELSKTNTVYLMYPGQINPINREKVKYKLKKSTENFQVIEMLNPLPVSLGLGISEEISFMEKRDITDISRLLQKLKIEVVHLHTLMGLPLELLQEIKRQGIKIIFTSHDFYGLCPKMLDDDPEAVLGEYRCTDDCMLCKDGPSKQKLYIMQSHVYAYLKNSSFVKKIRANEKNNLKDSGNIVSIVDQDKITNRVRLREYYLTMFECIDKFHFNSNISKEYIERFLPTVEGKVVQLTHTGLSDKRQARSYNTRKEKLILGYIGPYDQKKGFFKFKQSLEELRQLNDKFEVFFCGDVASDPFFENSWVTNLGVVTQRELADIYQKLDILVVPSKWHETFGFVVLEAASFGVIPLVSENVGAKDLLSENFTFKLDELAPMLANLASDASSISVLRKDLLELSLPVNFSEHTKKIMKEFYV